MCQIEENFNNNHPDSQCGVLSPFYGNNGLGKHIVKMPLNEGTVFENKIITGRKLLLFVSACNLKRKVESCLVNVIFMMKGRHSAISVLMDIKNREASLCTELENLSNQKEVCPANE